MPNASDSEQIAEEVHLLTQIGMGDREAFRRLYLRYSPALFSLTVRFVGNTGEAEELLQDAFMKIWRHAATYDSRKSQPFTWAVTIVRRTCIDHLRKRRRQVHTAPLPLDSEQTSEFAVGENIRVAAESQETAARVNVALGDLPASQRAALELALYSELTHAEISERLAQPVGTIKTWIRRGLSRLRTRLSDSDS